MYIFSVSGKFVIFISELYFIPGKLCCGPAEGAAQHMGGEKERIGFFRKAETPGSFGRFLAQPAQNAADEAKTRVPNNFQ